MPEILLQSKNCQARNHLDLSIFQGKLDDEQISFVEKVFLNANSVNISTTNFDDNEVFYILDKFKMVNSLKISLSGDDKFVFPPEPLKLSNIKINCITKNIWLDPVNQILSNNTEDLKRFSLLNSYLSATSIETLHSNNIEWLTLDSLILISEDDKLRLSELIRFKRTLKKLKVISNRKITFQNSFESFSEELLENFNRPFENLEILCFTLDQSKVLNNFNLRFLTNLRKLTVYYTTERSFNNIENIILEINSLRKDNILNIPAIEFIEYFSQNQALSFINSQKMIELQIKSNGFATKIIETSDKYIKISHLKF